MFEAMQGPFLNHVINIKHQFKVIKFLKGSLADSDLFLHLDFSENYKCKYSAEPQSVHFGASRKQITLQGHFQFGCNFTVLTLFNFFKMGSSTILCNLYY